MVSSGQLPELVKRANDLDAEIKEGKGWEMLSYGHPVFIASGYPPGN